MNSDKNYCTLYLVRHGESVSNKERTIQGHLDTPLTDLGVEQAKQVATVLRDTKFDAIFSSDLLRAKQTAEILKLERDLTIKTSELLRERTFGKFEGMKSEDFRKELKKEIEAFEKLSTEEKLKDTIHGEIESEGEMTSRFITYLREISVAHPNKKVLVSAHGGPIRLLLIHLGWAKYEELPKGSLKNSGYVVLESDGVDFFVKDVIGAIKTGSNIIR